MRRDQRDDAIAAAIVAGGAMLRLIGWTRGQLFVRATETEHVAVALATTGRFADAFGPGSGPTAHVSPAMPWLMAAVYRMLGVDTPGAELMLAVVAVGLIALATWFGYRLFTALGAGRGSRLTAVAVLALLPVQFKLEVTELRVWEGPLTVATMLGVLFVIVRLDARPTLHPIALLPPIAATALLVLASPPATLALIAALGVLAVRRLRFGQQLGAAAMVAAAVVGVSLPWALHNQAVLGRLIWTRSNANLELAVAYNDTMLAATDDRRAYLARLAAIHPDWRGGDGYPALIAAGGELAYNDRLGAATRAWLRVHPIGAGRLLLRHLGELVAPPEWFFYAFDLVAKPSVSAVLRAGFLAATLIMALGGGIVLAWRDRRYLYVLVPLIAVMLPYVVVQPILRYRYLVYALSVFLAADVAGRVAVRLRLISA